MVLACIACLLATVAAAFGGFLASITIYNAEGDTRNAWLTNLVIVLNISAVAIVPTVITVLWFPRRAALTVRLIAVFVSSIFLLIYGTRIGSSAPIGALGHNDRSASTLLVPSFVLAPFGAVLGISVLVAILVSKKLLWKFLIVWCLLLALIGLVAVHVRINCWYGAA
ncbi:hypothetical protein ACI7YT_10175 [Microbacterium sp. M]|uniref:hypothetical protein n=1 Tax=Microbacterium sp. M TaxID=3377125 RepID=UPI00386E23BE